LLLFENNLHISYPAIVMELLFLEKHAIPPGVNLPNYDKLAKSTNFTTFELKRMFCRFCTLCLDHGSTTGRIDKYTFLQQPELSFCYLAEFAFEFEQGKTKAMVAKGSIWPRGLDFPQFVTLFDHFSPLNASVKKADCKQRCCVSIAESGLMLIIMYPH
jgi:hypothetical protein